MGAARAAIRNEPLRETAHAALIRLHLVAGNQHEAVMVYERYATALQEALQLSPSPLLRDLVRGLRADSDDSGMPEGSTTLKPS